MQIEFRVVDPAVAPASDLLAAMVAEMNLLYGAIDGAGSPSATPADFSAPAGAFLVGRADGEPVCAGAIKRFADGVAEIKRMYVVPAARGRGVARALLGALEDTARRLGYGVVRLDTGPRQPHALALYAACGYAEVADYNANPHATYWGEKRL